MLARSISSRSSAESVFALEFCGETGISSPAFAGSGNEDSDATLTGVGSGSATLLTSDSARAIKDAACSWGIATGCCNEGDDVLRTVAPEIATATIDSV